MDAPVNRAELILQAALALFVVQGFDATAVPEIASRAGVGTGTVYRHFPDKSGLVNVLFRRWRADFNRNILAPMPLQLSPAAQFSTYWRRVLGWYRGQLDPAVFLELHCHDTYLDTHSRQIAGAHEQALKAFVKSGIGACALRPTEAEIVVAMLRGTATTLLRQEAVARARGETFLTLARIEQSATYLWQAIAA